MGKRILSARSRQPSRILFASSARSVVPTPSIPPSVSFSYFCRKKESMRKKNKQITLSFLVRLVRSILFLDVAKTSKLLSMKLCWVQDSSSTLSRTPFVTKKWTASLIRFEKIPSFEYAESHFSNLTLRTASEGSERFELNGGPVRLLQEQNRVAKRTVQNRGYCVP